MSEHTFEAFYDTKELQGQVDALFALAVHCPQEDRAENMQGLIRAIAASAYQQGRIDLLLETPNP